MKQTAGMHRERKEGLELQGHFLVKRFLLSMVTLSCMVPLGPGGQNISTNSGSWSGIVVSSACNADEAFNESPECFKAIPGAKLALYDDTNRVMYSLEPQPSVTTRLGDAVTVWGTLEGETIRMEIGRAHV